MESKLFAISLVCGVYALILRGVDSRQPFLGGAVLRGSIVGRAVRPFDGPNARLDCGDMNQYWKGKGGRGKDAIVLAPFALTASLRQ